MKPATHRRPAQPRPMSRPVLARWLTPDDIVAAVHNGSMTLSSPVSISWHLLDGWMRRRADTSLRDLVTA